MGRRVIVGALSALVLLGQAGILGAQAAQPAGSVGAVLQSLTARAAVVFVGQVVKIERQGVGANGVAAIVEVTFAVQQPVLGNTGATYVLREWGGLWPPGAQRYRLGQRAMVFLHGAGSSGLSSPGLSSPGLSSPGLSSPGLSSPVDGLDGVVPLVPAGADTAPLLDVRRLSARVQRAVGQPMGVVEAMGLPEVAALVQQTAATPTVTLIEPVHYPLPVGVVPKPVKITYMLPVRGRPVQSDDAR